METKMKNTPIDDITEMFNNAKDSKIRFIPHIVDHPMRTFHTPTTEEFDKMNQMSDKISELKYKYKVHNVINEYIYMPLWENGYRIDKSLRIKVDGDIYKKIVSTCGGELPRYVQLEHAKNLDENEIH